MSQSFTGGAMASGIKKLVEKSRCSICRHLMMEPVTVECGHNFCQKCIEGTTKNQQVTPPPGSSHCPLCQAPFQSDSLKSNEQLENLIEFIKKLERERLCEEHGEQLQLFCKDDEQLICWNCEQSPQHKGHNTALVEVIYRGYKEKLQESVTKLKEDQDFCESAKLFTRKQIIKWQDNVELQKEKIQSGFRNLHNCLHEEEKCHLWRLENKKEQDPSSFEDGEASQGKQRFEPERYVWKLEKKCQDPGLDLLQIEAEIQTQKIKCDFEKSHNFLHEKEKIYIERLEEEKIQMLKQLQDSEASLAKQSHILDTLILELEEKCQYPAQKLLQDAKDTFSRDLVMKLEMPEAISLELRTECPFSKIYSEMKEKFLSPDADSSAVEHRADEGQSGVGPGLGPVGPESPSKRHSEARVRFAPYSKHRVPIHYRHRHVNRPAQEQVSCIASNSHLGPTP